MGSLIELRWLCLHVLELISLTAAAVVLWTGSSVSLVSEVHGLEQGWLW